MLRGVRGMGVGPRGVRGMGVMPRGVEVLTQVSQRTQKLRNTQL